MKGVFNLKIRRKYLKSDKAECNYGLKFILKIPPHSCDIFNFKDIHIEIQGVLLLL